MRRIIFIVFLLCFFSVSAHALHNQLPPKTINFQNTKLVDALKSFADLLNINILISSKVTGYTNLRIENVSGLRAFDALLLAHGLSKLKRDGIWLIAPQAEIINLQQEILKHKELSDKVAPTFLHVWRLKFARVEEVVHLLKDQTNTLLSNRGHFNIDVRTNTLYVEDIAEKIEQVRFLMKQIDVEVKQVLIEARLASVDSDYERDLGITFSSTRQPLPEGNYRIGIAHLAGDTVLDVKLTAMEKMGHADLLSSPTLITANLQAASIEAGEEVPYQEVSEGGGTAVAFKKAVLGLKVTPQIMPNSKIMLRLQINQDRPSKKLIQGVPTISTRQIISNVEVQSGCTIVLGGIYELNGERSTTGIPYIHQIPLIGSLFRQHNDKKSKRELLIFITPKILYEK